MEARQSKVFTENSLEHGGSIRRGKRKIQRPFDARRPMHIVMRSTRAKGDWSFLRPMNRSRIENILDDACSRYKIKRRGFENVGNHLHLFLQFPSRAALTSFLRVFAQRVMFWVTGACRGKPKGRFFDAIAYSRVVNWGREIQRIKDYFLKNRLESMGFAKNDAVAMTAALKRSRYSSKYRPSG